MSARATTDDEQREQTQAGPAGHPVEEGAEEIVERVSEQLTQLFRRLAARTREEIEDIVAEAQSIRRGDQPHD